MTIGLVGRKVGMMRIFTDEGDAQPVTVLDVSDNRITQIKTADKDGYAAVQVAFGKRRASRVKKPLAGHLAKAAVEAGHTLKEFRAETKDLANLKVGGKIGVEIFKVGQKVDVQGTTIGKGFAGVIKRHHFGGNRATHGNSITHARAGLDRAAPGSGPRLPRQAHGGPSGQRHAHHAEPGGGAHRYRAPAPAGQGLGPRLCRARHRRAAGRQGRQGRTSAGEGPGAAGQGLIMELKLINDKGAAGTLAAKDEIFGRDFNEALVHQIVVSYAANARRATSKQKDRGEVRHSTKKPWRQKGTGRARAGMTSSPLWRGGGKIFPNTAQENYAQKVNRKMYRAGMASILSQLAREDRIRVVDEFKVAQPKTKLLAQKVKSMGFNEVLVITDEIDSNLTLSSRNLPNVEVIAARQANPVALVRYPAVLLTKGALARLEEMFK